MQRAYQYLGCLIKAFIYAALDMPVRQYIANVERCSGERIMRSKHAYFSFSWELHTLQCTTFNTHAIISFPRSFLAVNHQNIKNDIIA
jgi:hypothetical protein